MTVTTAPHVDLARAQSLVIGGFELATCHAWPGTLAAEVQLLEATATGRFTWDEVRWVLHERRGLVDAVVFTGDEPTARPGLADAMIRARELGYQVGLRTTGAYPRRLADVLPLADWVGIEVAGAGSVTARTSLELIMRSGVEYEVTLTVDPKSHSRQDVLDAVREVIRSGGHAPVLRGRGLYDVIRVDDLPDLERR